MAKSKTVSDANNIFTACLLVADKPTSDGRVYPLALVQSICDRLNTQPPIIVQEMNPVERKLKNISMAEPWDKKVMAIVMSAQIIKNVLCFTAECKTGRDGKMLAGMVEKIGLENIEFFPVGYGTTNSSNIVDYYKINYIAVELKKK